MIQPIIAQSKQQFRTKIRTKPIYDYFKRRRRKTKKSASIKKNIYKNRKKTSKQTRIVRMPSTLGIRKTPISKDIRTLTPMEIQPEIPWKYKKDLIQLPISF